MVYSPHFYQEVIEMYNNTPLRKDLFPQKQYSSGFMDKINNGLIIYVHFWVFNIEVMLAERSINVLKVIWTLMIFALLGQDVNIFILEWTKDQTFCLRAFNILYFYMQTFIVKIYWSERSHVLFVTDQTTHFFKYLSLCNYFKVHSAKLWFQIINCFYFIYININNQHLFLHITLMNGYVAC